MKYMIYESDNNRYKIYNVLNKKRSLFEKVTSKTNVNKVLKEIEKYLKDEDKLDLIKSMNPKKKDLIKAFYDKEKEGDKIVYWLNEDKIDNWHEKELEKIQEKKLRNFWLDSNHTNDRLNVLDIIYGKKEEEDEEEDEDNDWFIQSNKKTVKEPEEKTNKTAKEEPKKESPKKEVNNEDETDLPKEEDNGEDKTDSGFDIPEKRALCKALKVKYTSSANEAIGLAYVERPTKSKNAKGRIDEDMGFLLKLKRNFAGYKADEIFYVGTGKQSNAFAVAVLLNEFNEKENGIKKGLIEWSDSEIGENKIDDWEDEFSILTNWEDSGKGWRSRDSFLKRQYSQMLDKQIDDLYNSNSSSGKYIDALTEYAVKLGAIDEYSLYTDKVTKQLYFKDPRAKTDKQNDDLLRQIVKNKIYDKDIEHVMSKSGKGLSYIMRKQHGDDWYRDIHNKKIAHRGKEGTIDDFFVDDKWAKQYVYKEDGRNTVFNWFTKPLGKSGNAPRTKDDKNIPVVVTVKLENGQEEEFCVARINQAAFKSFDIDSMLELDYNM